MGYVMQHKGFMAKVMEAPRLKGENLYNLPPGTSLQVYPVDTFLKIPENWMRGGGVFVVTIKPETGLWFDWRDNSHINTAIISTVKGTNPITGLQTSGFHLERYETMCPKHNIPFLAERFCEKCNYKWPPQNYVAYPNPLWWDIWTTEEGVGRQMYFSEDELRDIATALIGKENTVPAFGFAFYSPKERRPEPAPERIIKMSYINGDFAENGGSIDSDDLYEYGSSSTQVYLNSCASSPILGHNGIPCMDSASVMFSASVGEMKFEESLICLQQQEKMKTSGSIKSLKAPQKQIRCRQVVKEVSIGAGAKINQALNQDSYPLDSWKEAPDSVMTIYFVFQEKFEELKADGMRDLSGIPEGMLAKLPVG